MTKLIQKMENKFLEENKKSLEKQQEIINKTFVKACKKGDLETIQYLFTSTTLPFKPDTTFEDYDGFLEACVNGRLEVVQYLFTSPDVPTPPDIHCRDDSPLRLAALNNHFELTRYLLTSPDLKEHAAINGDNGVVILNISIYGSVELAHYLLTSPELEEHADVNIPAQDMFSNTYSGAYQLAISEEKWGFAELYLSLTGEQQLLHVNECPYNLQWALENNNLLMIVAIAKHYALNDPLEYIVATQTIQNHFLTQIEDATSKDRTHLSTILKNSYESVITMLEEKVTNAMGTLSPITNEEELHI